MKAFMCDVCGKAAPAGKRDQEISAGFGFSLGVQSVDTAPEGWYGVARFANATSDPAALLCSTDCVLRFVHRKTEVST